MLLCLLLWAAPAAAQPLTFAALGDFPYCNTADPAGCEAEVARLHTTIAAVNAARPAFSVFVGDTKAGGEQCTDAIVFERTAAWFARFEGPLVYTPGDNEWTDCWQPRAGGFDANDLLRRIRARFFSAPVSLGGAPMAVVRQADVAPAHASFVENARWSAAGVLFTTVHIVGSDNNRPPETGAIPPGAAEEFPGRDAANIAWIAEAFAVAAREGQRVLVFALQGDMWWTDRCRPGGGAAGYAASRAALVAGARALDRPVLVIHGDSHFPLLDRPEVAAPRLVRLMLPGAQDIRAVMVTVDPGAVDPFRFRMVGAGGPATSPFC